MRLSPDHRVWLLNAAIVLGAVALAAGPVLDLASYDRPLDLPWWTLAAGFAVAERFVVHFHFRRSSHAFSMGELPLVLGLVFAEPGHLLLGGVVGAFVALGSDREIPPIKVAFNLAQFTLGAGVACIVFHAANGGQWHAGPVMWAAALAAATASALVAVLLISAAISMSEGSIGWRGVFRMIGMDLTVTTINTALACLGAAVLAFEPWAATLLVVPSAALLLAYRAYLAERQRHRGLEFLYDATRTMSRSPDIDRELQDLLKKALGTFRVEVAEIVLLSADGKTALRTTLGPGTRTEVMAPIALEEAEALCALVSGAEPAVAFDGSSADPQLASHFDELAIRQSMVALLPGESRQIGVLLLANRAGVQQPFASGELRLLEALANNASVALQADRLEHVVSRLTELQRQLEHQAFHDSLTGLSNRSRFLDRTQEALNDRGGLVALLYIDLDDFKTINDSLGHAAGDALLRVVGRRLRHTVRPSDTAARLGGDEFAVLLREVSSIREVEQAAARIRAALRPPVQLDDHTLNVELTIGIATALPGTARADELIRNADVAMYRAKHGGKAGFGVFEPGMEVAVQRRHRLKEDLQRAVERGEFASLYQPLVDLESGEVTAVEALMRWRHPTRGLVSPPEFIELAEETGLIVSMGRIVLSDACRYAAAWTAAGAPTGARVHVNVSAVELEQQDLPDWLADEVARHGLAPERLVLEVTETLLTAEAERALAGLERLHDAGFQIALDDFGTGYSSLSSLQALPVDMLKIPKPFIDGVAGDPRQSAIARASIGLARALGLHVVAEGIERPEQVAALRELRCDLGQGFLFSRPVVGEELLAPAVPELAHA
jgi:diguanylate cyclase (GGDEF)-like protein